MKRARAAALALAATAALAAPAIAGGQSASSFYGVFGGGNPVGTRSIPVRLSGQLTVSFHGDPATGCASRGLCGYSGSVSWRPPSAGTLEILEYRAHRRLGYGLILAPGSQSFFGPTGGTSTAMVALSAPASSCLDAVAGGSSIPLPLHRGRVTFTLAGASPSVLETRCAGPLARDITPYLPTPALALAAVLRGGAAVSLATSRSFASHGFAGTIASTLRLVLGRARRFEPARTRLPAGIKTTRERQLTVTYRASLQGTVNELVQGDANPVICGELGSCGLAGQLVLRPSASRATATFFASEAASKPARALLAAFGLAPGGRAGRPASTGEVSWSGGGLLSADLDQGSTRCLDSAPLGPGTVILGGGRGTLHAAYLGGLTTFGSRTRCPGPGRVSVSALASGTIPLRDLAHRTIKLTLRAGTSFADDGYQVRTVPDLTLTLTRLRAHASMSTVPGGVG